MCELLVVPQSDGYRLGITVQTAPLPLASALR